MLFSPARLVYPRFLRTHLRIPKGYLNFLKNVNTKSGKTIHEDRIRQRLIHEISQNPGILSSSNVSINTHNTSWTRKMALFAASCGLFMGMFFTHQYYQVYTLDDEEPEPRTLFLPCWLGMDWPRQRRLAFPTYLQYFDPGHSAVKDDHNFMDVVGRENVERQVLDCLFRLPIIRETFKFPISVKITPEDIFQVWIEPHHCTVHGPQFSIVKANGKVTVDCTWAIKLIKWATDLNDIVSGFTSEFDSLTEAQRNTHDKSSGRVHEANTNDDHEPLECSLRNQDYNIAFRGTLNVTDLKQQHKGSVSYTGVIDNSHLALSGGVRILTLTLEVSEYGKCNTLYKLK